MTAMVFEDPTGSRKSSGMIGKRALSKACQQPEAPVKKSDQRRSNGMTVSARGHPEFGDQPYGSGFKKRSEPAGRASTEQESGPGSAKEMVRRSGIRANGRRAPGGRSRGPDSLEEEQQRRREQNEVCRSAEGHRRKLVSLPIEKGQEGCTHRG